MGFDLIYLGFGLLVKVEVIILLTYQQPKKVLVLLGEVKLKSELYECLIAQAYWCMTQCYHACDGPHHILVSYTLWLLAFNVVFL